MKIKIESTTYAVTWLLDVIICRAYALRRIKDAFRENKDVTDPERINQLLSKAKQSLEIVTRQVKVSSIKQVVVVHIWSAFMSQPWLKLQVDRTVMVYCVLYAMCR